jgi:hypothetical protein
MATRVVEVGTFLLRLVARLQLEVVHRPAQVLEQAFGQVAAEVLLHHDALHHQVPAVPGHRVGGHQPAALAELVGQIVEAEARALRVLLVHLPAEDRDVVALLVHAREGEEREEGVMK